MFYYNGERKAEVVVYDGASVNGLPDSVMQRAGSKMEDHDFFLRVKHQPDLSNILFTPS